MTSSYEGPVEFKGKGVSACAHTIIGVLVL